MIFAVLIIVFLLFISVDIVRNRIKDRLFRLLTDIIPYVSKDILPLFLNKINPSKDVKEAKIRGNTIEIPFFYKGVEYKLYEKYTKTNSSNEYFGLDKNGDEEVLEYHLPGLEIRKKPLIYKNIFCRDVMTEDEYEILPDEY